MKRTAVNLPSSVVRAKGFVEVEGSLYIFNYVMGEWSLEDPDIHAERIKHKNILVFTGPINSMEGIGRAVDTGIGPKVKCSSPTVRKTRCL